MGSLRCRLNYFVTHDTYCYIRFFANECVCSRQVHSDSQSPDNEDRDAEALIDVVPEKQIEESEQTAETDR